MKRRILNIIAVLFLMVGTAAAQSLSVADLEVKPNGNALIEVNISAAAEMTALQFNLSLPNGLLDLDSSNGYGFISGGAVKGHTVNVLPLESGDYLVVLYNMNKTTFGDGVLLSISVVAGENAGTVSGSLYNVRMSTADAVSYKCEDASFKVTVNAPTTGVDEVKAENGEVKTIYDLQGRKVNTSSKGLYIINGKKVLVK